MLIYIDQNVNPEYLTVKEIGKLSNNSKIHSSNREESHSFYSEIDFSKENLWGNKGLKSDNAQIANIISQK